MSMNETRLISAWRESQGRLRAAVAAFGDEGGYRRCWHEELSPPGWHLEHCVYVEHYWLREVLLERAPPPASGAWMPGSLPKRSRGAQLLPLKLLLRRAAAHQAYHRCLLRRAAATLRRHPLIKGHYLARFFLQHHAMHAESLALSWAQRALRCFPAGGGAEFVATGPRAPNPHRSRLLPAGRYRIGARAGQAPFDNEFCAHEVRLDAVRISRRPLNCTEYAAFIEAGGYRRPEYWSRQGWEWRCRRGCEAPEYWCRDAAGRWCGIGGLSWSASGPVWGISHYEAAACAAWAGGRLPHEYEWEAARRSGLLEGCGQAWEWCANVLHPYPGFRPYPYEDYSTPWFDGGHYTLRGGSRFSGPWLRRPGFRNFYLPGHRHLRAGLRLVYDDRMGRKC